MKFIGFIPARKGSKSVKSKNYYKIKKKSLIEYTFDKIKKIKLLNQTYLSSNDDRLIKIANSKYKNINTSYKRPNSISRDGTSMIDTVYHFINWLTLKKINFDYIVILQPTSPCRNYNDVNNAIKHCIKNKYESLMSISSLMNHPNEMIIKDKNKWRFFLPSSKKTYQRQQFNINPYFNDGSIYILSKKLIREKKIFSKKKQGFFYIKKINSFDINDYEDLEILKKLL